jgi:outer membrane receptor for ferric coprogen and ferric-rhodotorulic acid
MQFPPHALARAAALACLLTTLAPLFDTGALAQTADEAATLPAVSVSASGAGDSTGGSYRARRSQTALGLNLSRRDTPQSVSVVTRAQMDDFGLVSVNDVLDQVTGVQVQRVETDRTYYTARGFDVTNFQYDGVGLPFTNGAQWGDLDMALYERVDVLRGANGLLSSTGNPSATVNFVSKKPTRDFTASAALTLGSWNERRGEVDLSGPLDSEGRVRGRLIAVRDSHDSYLDRYHVDRTLLSGMLDVDLTRDTQLSLSYVEQHNDADSPMWGALPLTYSDGTPTDYDVSTSTATDWAWWHNTERRAQATLTQDLGSDWLLKATVMQRRLSSDSDLFYVYGTPNRDTSSGSGLYAYPSAFTGSYTQSMTDVRASGPFTLAGRQHELLAGLSWAHEQARERSDYGQGIGDDVPDLSTWNGSTTLPSFDNGTDGSRFNMLRRSAYAATRLSVRDDLKVIVGANATQVSSSGENYGVAHAYDRGRVTPYLGAVLDLTPEVSAYASVTRIFNPQTEVDRTLQVLRPIEGHSTEAGLKSEWLDKRLSASLGVFRTRQNHTASADGHVGIQQVYREEDATATGYELELSGKPLPGWELNGGWTQLSLHNDEGDDARTFVPRRTLRVASTWELLPALKVGAAMRYQSRVAYSNAADSPTQASYAVVDLMAGYTFSRQWKLDVQLRNVGDKKYLNSLYWDQAYYGAPRNLQATLRYTY